MITYTLIHYEIDVSYAPSLSIVGQVKVHERALVDVKNNGQTIFMAEAGQVSTLPVVGNRRVILHEDKIGRLTTDPHAWVSFCKMIPVVFGQDNYSWDRDE